MPPWPSSSTVFWVVLSSSLAAAAATALARRQQQGAGATASTSSTKNGKKVYVVVPAASGSASCKKKTLHLVRHAQATHNEAFLSEGRAAYAKECHADARLTAEGQQQCAALEKSIASSSLINDVELVVISPLTRTIQTAQACFSSLSPKVPWIVLESLRERAGGHPCDRRRTVTELKVDFPSIDWNHMKSDTDRYWRALGPARETDSMIVDRAAEFFEWVAARPEEHIAVVTHSAFLFTLLNKAVICPKPLSVWFENCEMRSVDIYLDS